MKTHVNISRFIFTAIFLFAAINFACKRPSDSGRPISAEKLKEPLILANRVAV